MPSEIKIINPLIFKDWDELVLGTTDYSFFHSSKWARVLYEEYKYELYYFTVINHDKLLVLAAFMEVNSFFTGRRGVSLPFTDHCVPIVNKEIQTQDLVKCIVNHGKKRGWKSIEFRGTDIFSEGTIRSGYYFGHTLQLSGEVEEVLSRFRSSTRRNIYKAIKGGVEVKVSNSLASIKEFYKLHLVTRKKHGLPPQPYSFFKNVFRHIISKNFGIVVLAEYKSETIAGAIYFHFGEKVIYKYGASDEKYLYLRPNNLVMWKAIKWYSGKGYRGFSLGRTEPGNKGLRQFKNGWGTEEKRIDYYKFDLNKNIFIKRQSFKFEIMNRLFYRTPVFLLRLVGFLFYKHMG